MIKFEKKLFDPATAEQVSAFERRHSVTLPVEFREFLFKQNGGFGPTPHAFTIPDIGEHVAVDLIYGIGPPSKRSNLETKYEEFRDDLPEEFLPIGHDPGGNLILIAVAGDLAGQVHYYDAVLFYKTSSEVGNIYFIAEDFERFLESLHD